MVATIWQRLLYNLEAFCLVINFPHDIPSSSPRAFQRSSGLSVTVSQLILFSTHPFSKILHRDLYFQNYQNVFYLKRFQRGPNTNALGRDPALHAWKCCHFCSKSQHTKSYKVMLLKCLLLNSNLLGPEGTFRARQKPINIRPHEMSTPSLQIPHPMLAEGWDLSLGSRYFMGEEEKARVKASVPGTQGLLRLSIAFQEI